MKSIYRLIRILSCALVIATVLLCSIFVPAMAANIDYFDPNDYYDRTVYEGNFAYLYYNFGNDAYFSVRNQSNGITTSSYGAIDIFDANNASSYVFRIFPLGSSFTPGNKMSRGVIKIADFKSKGIFEITQSVDFSVQYFYYQQVAGESDFYFETEAYACFYDVDGNFISDAITNRKRTFATLTGSDPDENYGYNMILDLDMPLEIPENAVYMAPCLLAYFYPPDVTDPHYITQLEASTSEFYLRISKNFLLEQSELMDSIDDQLGDLVNGSDDQWNAAQNGSDNVTDFKDEVNANKELEKEWLDDFDESSDSLNNTISGFVNGKGFTQLSTLVSPIMTWENTGVIMMLLIAFINMSIILFGR